MRGEGIFRLIDEIYETSLEPERWSRTLASVSSFVGCSFISLVPYSDPAALVTSGMEEKARRVYAGYWYQHDAMVGRPPRR